LKGSAFTFGADRVGAIAADIEREARRGVTDLATLTTELEAVFTQTVAEIQAQAPVEAEVLA
jgi:HPt (histidine-containing phosphotransfer) domain-containing protein